MGIITLILVMGCSTKKNTFTRRAYHNLTSHYNVYWNGKESMIEAMDNLELKVKDDYTNVLPVFNYGIAADAQSIFPQLDRSIKKASIAIQKHSMVFDGEEKVNWIDDCYMLIGKAYFYKQEYISARRTFNFVIKEYGYTEAKYDAMLWLTRTHIANEEYIKAEPMLNLILKDIESGLVPYEIQKEIPQIFADLYIRQEKYNEAVDYLYEAIAMNPKRDLETRMMFILGQIFQRNDDLSRASDQYTQVIKRNPPYEMAFQAKINLARSYDARYGDSKQVIKILSKMLRDDKNIDFKDQIYFALAEVALRDGLKEEAINYLRLSVESSTTNNIQKATSALTVADLYFAMPDYTNSQAYYDTAMMFLPKDYPNYSQISAKTKILSKLVEQLITIQHQDSLQKLSRMTDSERIRIVDGIIKELIEEQRRLQEEKELKEALRIAEAGSAQAQTGTDIKQGFPIGGASEWYFYNTTTKQAGHSDFVKKWGIRTLEDLWRLSSKQFTSFGYEEPIESDTVSKVPDSTIAAKNDPMRRDFYLKDIPFTPEAIAKSDTMIMLAYFELGRLYYDGLEDYNETKLALENMNERFPGNPNELRSYYYLYKTYQALGDLAMEDFYKNLIISKYPESDYAKVLIDPDYFKKLAEEKNKVSILYEDTYKSYEAGQFYAVISKADLALAIYGDTNQLAPKFAILRAFAIGRVDVLDSLVVSLKNVIIKYPNSEIKTLAQSVLGQIIQDHPEYADEMFTLPGIEPEKPTLYSFNPGLQHMFILIVDSKQVRLNPLKVKFSDYNNKYYSLDNLNINSLVLDKEHFLVTVGNFNNSAKAKLYLEGITKDEYVFSDVASEFRQGFIISTENYPIFFKEKNIEDYKVFFEKNYKK